MATTEQCFGRVLAETTMKAAVEIMAQRGLVSDRDYCVDALCAALRRESKVALKTFMEDGKVLLDAGRAPYLTTLLQVECVDAARRACDSLVAS